MNLPDNPLESFRKRNVHLYPGAVLLKLETTNAAPGVFVIKPSTDEAKLNKTERARLAHLRMLGLTPVGIQDITLKLGDDCRFTPDFNYICGGQFYFEDVKGF